MGRLFKAFFFKLSRDWTFRITLIIGAAIAIIMTLIYLFMDHIIGAEEGSYYLTGQTMLINSMSPAQNFGLAIPINLVTFVALEFSQGTIRNKIIAGHSKFRIYASLFLTGLVFCFALLITYLLICTGLGSIFGGFDLSKKLITGLLAFDIRYNWEYILKMLAICFVTYVCIVSFTVFVTTLLRHVGPCIPIVLIVIVMLYSITSVWPLASVLIEDEKLLKTIETTVAIADPLFGLSAGTTTTQAGYAAVENRVFILTIASNLIYASAFFAGGALIFSKRDVK